MIPSDFFVQLTLLADKHPKMNISVTVGEKNVYSGMFDQGSILAAMNHRDFVVSLSAREAFFSAWFLDNKLKESWRSPNGEWIGKEFGLDGRNVFGDLPPIPREKPERQIGERKVLRETAPETEQPIKDDLADAARTGNLAAAISK